MVGKSLTHLPARLIILNDAEVAFINYSKLKQVARDSSLYTVVLLASGKELT